MKRTIVLLALMAGPAFADTVYLRGGGQMTGEIVKRTDDSVTVDIGGATLTARMSSVVRIEESISPLQEYRSRAADIPDGDTEAWRELARWARGRTLASQAEEAYLKVLEVLPDDEEANRALGRVQLNGRWVSEEESYRAQGYIEFEGAWMRPAERESILADRRAREEADRRENAAQIKAIEAEQQAAKEREAREAAERDSWSQMNDLAYWGWGPGPGYWPPPSRQWPENPATGGR